MLSYWPLPVRLSLAGLANPDIRTGMGQALILLGFAVLMLTLSPRFPRVRVVAAALTVAGVVACAAAARPLLVQAWPTSFRTSPTGFTAASIEAGQAVFQANCMPCHGTRGDGSGGRGAIASLLRYHIWTHPVGDLFWFVSHGRRAEDDGPGMPGFESLLPEDARWSAIDYVLALNAGAVSHGMNGWPHRVTAPETPLSCPVLGATSLRGLRGKVVRLLVGPVKGPVVALAPVNGFPVVTVWVPGGGATAPNGIDCQAISGAGAWAILAGAGATGASTTPARFLVDPEGVLRSVVRAGADDGAPEDPARLLEDVRTICTEPLTIDPGEVHEHASKP